MYRHLRIQNRDSLPHGTFRKIPSNAWSPARQGKRPLNTNTNRRIEEGFQ
jgi:hypothetical protein